MLVCLTSYRAFREDGARFLDLSGQDTPSQPSILRLSCHKHRCLATIQPLAHRTGKICRYHPPSTR